VTVTALGEAAHAPVEFVAIADAIGIAIGVQGVGFDCDRCVPVKTNHAQHLLGIAQAVEIGIGSKWIRPQSQLVTVG